MPKRPLRLFHDSQANGALDDCRAVPRRRDGPLMLRPAGLLLLAAGSVTGPSSIEGDVMMHLRHLMRERRSTFTNTHYANPQTFYGPQGGTHTRHINMDHPGVPPAS